MRRVRGSFDAIPFFALPFVSPGKSPPGQRLDVGDAFWFCGFLRNYFRQMAPKCRAYEILSFQAGFASALGQKRKYLAVQSNGNWSSCHPISVLQKITDARLKDFAFPS